MSSRALRRHQAFSHMMRRVKEDRNQHYDDLSCACSKPGKAMARFKEQPKTCSRCMGCDNPRHVNRGRSGLTRQEQRAADYAKVH